VSHMSDVGGHPGEIESHDVFSEGLCMPPFKLYEAGRENTLAFRIIGANCRAPELLLGDLRAMAGAAKIGSERFGEFLADYQLPDINGVAEAILDRSERLMRQRIRELPNGEYSYQMEIDGYIDTVHLHVRVTIEDESIHVDYAGSSDQRAGASINVPYNSTFATTMYPFKCALVPDVPNNEALFRPIRVSAPEGSILNARFPAPVKARAKTTNNLNQVIFGALWPVFGPLSQASNGGIWPLVLKGSEAGRKYLVDMLPYGGRGAMPELDGMHPVAYPTNSMITPCEVIESQAPIIFHQKALRPDTGAPGERRGGLGQTLTFEHVGHSPMIFSLTPDRIVTQPHGFNGGDHADVGAVVINGQTIFRFPAIELQPGDVVTLDIAGGGGFGRPQDRAPERMEHDLIHGYITPEGAKRYTRGE
jgi:N-methylhydantoinase B